MQQCKAALVGSHVRHHLPSLPHVCEKHCWLNQRMLAGEPLCQERGLAKCFLLPLRTSYRPAQSPVCCSSVVSRCRQVWQRDLLVTEDIQVEMGNVGTPPELFQQQHLIQLLALI